MISKLQKWRRLLTPEDQGRQSYTQDNDQMRVLVAHHFQIFVKSKYPINGRATKTEHVKNSLW